MYPVVAEFVQKQIARSRVATHLAIKLKHQCDAIIGARLGSSINSAANGEGWLIEQIVPQAKFFIDVGANAGNWSRAFASRMPRTARGIAFEPSPATAAELGEPPSYQQRRPFRQFFESWVGPRFSWDFQP